MTGRVLIDGRIIGYRKGGIANYARQLARLVPGVAPRLQVQVAVSMNVPELSDRAVRAFTPPHHRFERYAFGAEAKLRSPDLIHSPDYVHPHARGVAKVVTVHDLAFITHAELLTHDSLAYYAQVRASVQTADKVIAVSEWTRDQLLGLLGMPEDRIRVIPNGIDHQIFNTESSRDRCLLSRLHPRLLGIVDGVRPLVLAAGTIEPRKRIDILIKAFERMCDPGSTDRSIQPLLVVAGQAGWLVNDVLDALRRLQRQGNAIWIRDLDDHELAALYRTSSLLAMPSVDEGFGLPVLEAMACGTPALVAANGALPELAADSGFLEETEDPGAWADKILAILSDDEIRARRARRGIEKTAGYSWEGTARATAKVYEEVLG